MFFLSGPGPPRFTYQAGIFRGSASGDAAQGGGKEEVSAEVSSENSGQGKSRSVEDFELGEGEQGNGDDDEEEDEGNGREKKKKRKRFHRHTTAQIRQMEALFKESPHPDEKQRLELSKRLGLHPRQVKFWFQNRRTQVKAIQERHENSLLKSEIEKLRDEIKALRGIAKTTSCPMCGFPDNHVTGGEEQRLRIENSKLRAEVEKLRYINLSYSHGSSSNLSLYPRESSDQENKSHLVACSGGFRHEKSRIKEVVKQSVEELSKMATMGEPLWIRSYEAGREMLNYDEYVKEFPFQGSEAYEQMKSIEASRDSGTILVGLPWLVQSFMDVKQWKRLFPSLVTEADTIEVINNGEGDNKDGAILLIHAEIQMLTPMVPARGICFFRHCKQLNASSWAILDVSIDELEDGISSSGVKCRKRPSGCIIEDKSNGHCKVTWVEHLECRKTMVHSLYRTIVSRGLAFSAKRWISTLQQQCERLVFLVATNVPAKNSSGVPTLAGKKSILKLAQRMTSSFCRASGACSSNSWSKVSTKAGDDIRVASRENLNDNGEPLGMILSATTCAWFPLSHQALFDFLRDKQHRHEWDIMFKGSNAIRLVANLAKGQDRGNAVTCLAMEAGEQKTWLLQDSSTNASESLVVYSLVEISAMESVIAGCDRNSIQILPSGFSIYPDGFECKPILITSGSEEKGSGGSVLTVVLQILVSNSSSIKISAESVDSISNLVSCTLMSIKKSLQCQD